MRGGWKISLTDRFEKDFKCLPVDVKKKVEACIENISKDPIPNALRPHCISSAGKRPQVFSVDVFTNKSYKLSFHIDGDTAVLRRVGTHAQIDRSS